MREHATTLLILLDAERAAHAETRRLLDQANREIVVSIASSPREPDHVQHLTTRDRDDNPISPTCAYCGRAVGFCTGRIE